MNSTLPLDPAPVIIQKQQQMPWTQAVSMLAELAMQEDTCCLQMGDYLNAIEEQWSGRDRMRLAAQEAGITWTLARQRAWVAKRIPPGHPLRGTQLSYSHLRAVANSGDPLKWGNLALEHNWSVARLRGEIEMAADSKAQEEGYPCIECEQSLTKEMEIISFRIGRGKTRRCCGFICAAAYFSERANEQAFVVE